MNMLHRFARTLLAPALLAVASCQTGPPTTDELAHANYGSPISQEDAQAKATAWLQATLKDPDSMRAEWSPVKQGWQRETLGDLHFGYRMAASVNAKNSFGGYVGARPYVFMFSNGALAHVWAATDGRGFMSKVK